jgi:glycerophosphoryl diester phosphodiesterase
MEREVLWYVGGNNLKDLKRECPDCIGMPDPGPESNLATLLDEHRPKVVASVWRYYSKSFVEACHKAGAIVIVDESDPTCWDDAVAWGSDGIQTDHPEELIDFLMDRKRIGN